MIGLSREQEEAIALEFLKKQLEEINDLISNPENHVPMWSYNKKVEKKMNKFMAKSLKRVIAYNSMYSQYDDVDLHERMEKLSRLYVHANM